VNEGTSQDQILLAERKLFDMRRQRKEGGRDSEV